jgi:hypothetical protein
MPTYEHIIRFLYTYPRYVATRSPCGIVSYVTFSNGLVHVLQAIGIQYPKFKLANGEAARIKAVIGDLLEQGILTKDISRELQWLGSQMVFLLARASIEDALTAGCRNWDYVLQGALAMSLLTATGGRSGDIARTGSHALIACLKYSDVSIMVVTRDDEKEALECVVSLRYTKGNK